MTPTTKLPETAEALEERAAKLRAQAHEAEAELRRRDDDKRDAMRARHRAFDEELVASWDPRPLDAEVEATAAALDRALRADPVVLALVAAFHAQSRAGSCARRSSPHRVASAPTCPTPGCPTPRNRPQSRT